MNKLVAGFLLLSSCLSISASAQEEAPVPPSDGQERSPGAVCAPRKTAFETMKEKHFVPFAGGVSTSGKVVTFWVDQEGKWVITLSDPKTTCVADMGKGFEMVPTHEGKDVEG